MSSLAPGLTAATPIRSVHRPLSWVGVRTAARERKLPVALALIWLIDAALQFQPYMFGRPFVTQTLEPAAAGNMWIVEQPALWADHVMIHHITVYNSLFATIQLLIALGLVFRPTLKAALAFSVVWSFGVWWLAEGIGGVSNGASPFMGAPGAVILYAFVAILLWPRDDQRAAGTSVADDGLLGRRIPKVLWAVLWASFVALGLEAANRAPSALHDLVTGMQAGEAGWVKALDRGLASPLAHHGTEASIVFAVLYALVAVGIFHPATVRPAVGLAVGLGLAIWLAEDFGTILTGSATDVNSGLPLVLLAACFWPSPRGGPARRGTRPPGQRVVGKPRSTVEVAGSGQRDVTTLPRV